MIHNCSLYIPSSLLQYGLVILSLICDVTKSKVPLDTAAAPNTIRNVKIYIMYFNATTDLSIHLDSSIEAELTVVGGSSNTSHAFLSCCCLQRNTKYKFKEKLSKIKLTWQFHKVVQSHHHCHNYYYPDSSCSTHIC